MSIFERIRQMNITFRAGVCGTPTAPSPERVYQFLRTISDEVDELQDCVHGDGVDLVALADNLADQIVYNISEAYRHGIPIEEVLGLVLDSNESKLDESGNPIWTEDGRKFLKGPNYQPPEPAIAKLLSAKVEANKTN